MSSLAQESYDGDASSGTSNPLSLTCANNSALHVIGGANDVFQSLSIADGVNSFAKQGSDVVFGAIRLAHWTATRITGGLLAFLLTQSVAATNRFLIVREILGVGGFDIANSNTQPTPGVATDGVTVSATNTGFPAFLSAYALSCFFNTTMASGSGFTPGASQSTGGAGEGGWATQHKRILTAGSQAATFTTGNNGNTISLQAIFDEIVGGNSRTLTGAGT